MATRCPERRRWSHSTALAMLLVVLAAATITRGQATKPVTETDPTKAIGILRGELVDAFNKGEVDRLLSHLDPDVVVTWQNGEECRGPQEVRAFYDRMMTGPDRVVKRISVNPVVDDRHIYDGTWAVSWGNLHDDYDLNDRSSFRFDSRFTATIARRGEVWKVTAFHASVNAFDNTVLRATAKKVGIWTGVGGTVLGLLVGLVAGMYISRRRARGRVAKG